MTQRKPLKRVPMPPRKEWMKGSSLRSSKPSATGETQSKPRRSTGLHVGEKKAKDLAKQRSGGDCEVVILGVCVYRGYDFHHRLFRSQGGKWEIVNGLYVCRPCHRALTNTAGRRDEYEAKGWIVPSHADPAATEVLMWHNQRQDWFLLLEDGSVELAPFPKGDPRHPDDIEVPQESEIGGAA